MVEYSLTNFDRIRTEIDAAKDISELNNLADKLEAIRVLARQSKQSLEVQNSIAEYRLRVERKRGEWLKENITQGGDRKSNSREASLKLKDINISWDESSRAQMIANMKQKDFENYINKAKKTNEEITLSEAIREVKKIIREEKIDAQIQDIKNNKQIPITGQFDIIVIDPPWMYDREYDPASSRIASPYPEMMQEELLKIKLPAKEDCILWLWTTNTFMRDAYELIEAWGFAPKTILTWNKVNLGVGYYLRNVTEHCILAVKGSPIWTNKTHTTLINEKRTKHSAKPEAFYKLVDEICYGSKLDYFARKKREGWSVYGDEII